MAELMTVEELGRYLRFNKKTIYRLLKQDDIPAIKIEQGHTVVTAGTGAEGIERVKQWDFDLVFLDLKLPDTDGAEFLGQMRRAKPDLPITIITGYPGSEMMERALKQGPFGVMNKPFDSSDITNTVNSFLKARQPRRQTSKGDRQEG